MRRLALCLGGGGAIAWFATASAQVTPAAGYTPPDDTPSIRVGRDALRGLHLHGQSPQSKDTDGNTINPSAFNVARSYINITGNISHIVAFRITPDVVRQSGLITLGPGSSISNDSLIFRLKYAFAQVNLDDWMTRGSWARFGIQQTPLLDYEEGIYRYRFQGTTFTEREGLLQLGRRRRVVPLQLPSNYGDVHVGVYNGEGYAKAEPERPEGRSRFAARVRPFAKASAGAARPSRDGLLLRRQLHQERRADARGRSGDLRAPVHQRRLRLHQRERPDVDHRPRRRKRKGWSFWATPKKPLSNGSSSKRCFATTICRPTWTAPRTMRRSARGRSSACVLVPASGQRLVGADARLRRPDVRQLRGRHSRRRRRSPCTRWSISRSRRQHT